MTDWRPIETAPRDGTVILVYDSKFSERFGRSWLIDGDWFPYSGPTGSVHLAKFWATGMVNQERWMTPYTETTTTYLGEYTGTTVDTENYEIRPTHWLPLPNPPESE